MIGIIGAMSVEVEGLKAKITDAKSEVISGTEYVSGKLCGKDVVVAQCGIGKVFAALCANTMILKYGVSAIINTGVAGTLISCLSILDFAVSSAVVQHDMDTTAVGDAPGLISGINVVEIPASERLSRLAVDCAIDQGVACARGIIASGDQFISSVERKDYIRTTFGAIACEMEGAAIGQVCYVNGVDFCVLRSISDGGDEDAAFDYPKFVAEAAKKSISVLLRFLQK